MYCQLHVSFRTIIFSFGEIYFLFSFWSVISYGRSPEITALNLGWALDFTMWIRLWQLPAFLKQNLCTILCITGWMSKEKRSCKSLNLLLKVRLGLEFVCLLLMVLLKRNEGLRWVKQPLIVLKVLHKGNHTNLLRDCILLETEVCSFSCQLEWGNSRPQVPLCGL